MIGRRKPPATERTEHERAAAAAERMRRRGLDPSTVAGLEAAAQRSPDAEAPAPPSSPQPAPEAPEPPSDPAGPQPSPEEPAPVPDAPEAPTPPAPEAPAAEAPAPPAAEAPTPAAPPAPEAPAAEAPAPPPEDTTERPVVRPHPGPDEREPWDPIPGPVRTPAPPPPDPDEPLTARPAPPPPAEPRRRPAPALAGQGKRRRRPPSRPPRAPRRPLPPPARRPSRAGRRIAAVIMLLLLAAAAYLAYRTFQPGHGDPTGSVTVTVPAGADAGRIGDLLAARGVIDSGTFFSLNATITGRRGNLRPGDYTLQRDMRYGAVLDVLEQGPKAKVVKTFELNLPEGLSRRELVPRVKAGGIDGDYLKASAAAKARTQARRLGLPRRARNVEGFLFPATYRLPTGTDAADLVAAQLRGFRDNTAKVSFKAAKRKNLTRYDVLIIASMIEREAQLDRERPLIAAVIYNRLQDGMPLGIDATIRYAENNWSSPLKVSELNRPGPYNTRLNGGLPPTPIGNPGLASIRAAAHPADRKYRYYVVKPGTCGEHAFSSTDAQFARDRARYDAAREQAGGKSPTTC